MVQSALSGSSNPGTAPIPSGGTVRQRLSTSLRGSLDSNFRLASSKARYAMYMRFSVWCIISTMVLLHSWASRSGSSEKFMDLQSSAYCLCMKSPMAAWMSARVPLFSLSALTAAFLSSKVANLASLINRVRSRILQHSASQANISVCHTRHHTRSPSTNLPLWSRKIRPNVQPRPPELSSYTSSSSQPANAASSPRKGSDSASPPASSSESSVLIREGGPESPLDSSSESTSDGSEA